MRALAFAASAQTIDQGIAKFRSGDYAGALRDLMPFAEQGSATAQFLIGAIYANGEGVVRDRVAAASWIRRAAEQEHARDPDSDEAATWYRRAAEQGYASAQYNLGMLYYRGEGVPQDSVLAHVWVNLASSNGNEDATGVRGSIAAQLTASDIAMAQQIALQCRQQGYEYCVR